MPVTASADAELLQAFVNTRDFRRFVPRGHPFRDGTADALATPEDAGAWLVEYGLLRDAAGLDPEGHARLRALRATLRRALARGRDAAHPHRDDGADPEDAPDLDEAADPGASDGTGAEREPGGDGAAVPLRAVLDGDAGPRLESPGTGAEEAVGALAVAAVRTAVTGEWGRLRVCAAEDCRWVFFDASKPGRGRYCSPDSCGNRVKTRDYRRRRAEHGE